MASVQFYPINISYKILNDKAVIFIYGRTTDNRQICVIDRNFDPYFYAVVNEADKAGYIEKIKKIAVEKAFTYAVVRVEEVKKKHLGEDIAALKVYCNIPAAVPLVSREIKDMDPSIKTYEYDILFARRYLIDKRIIPMVLTDAEGDYSNMKSKVSVFDAAKVSQPKSDTIKDPKILSFDIETYTPLGKRMVPEKDPIIMVALYGDSLKKVITWKKFETKSKFIEFAESEKELLEKFVDEVDKYKPDIITGYYSDGFDFPYIQARAKANGVKVELGLDYSDLRISGKSEKTASITGISHFDVFKFVKRVISRSIDTDSYSLDAVSAEILGEKKIDVDKDKIPSMWDSDKPKNLQKLCNYNLKDAELTFRLADKLLANIVELVKIVGLSLDDINRMGFSQLVEWYLMNQASRFDIIAPNKPGFEKIKQRRETKYEGAFVFEPKPGLYKDIVIFDYRSLYPTIISSHNIGPDTLNCECCVDQAKKVPIENESYWFCKKKKGFVSTIIEDIITRRMRIKEIIKTKGSSTLLEARSDSLKLLGNSFYGYLGFFAARWYSLESAQSVTAYGRYYIHQVIDKAKDAGFQVVYSDTDSVFLTLDGKSKADSMRFSESVNMELPGLMELEYEGFYPAGIFVSAKESESGAKKRYALLTEDNIVKIKGFETVRRNVSFVAKETQERVLDIVLKEGDSEKAVKFVNGVISKLRNKEIPLEKVQIFTQLSKDIDQYDNIGPHVAVARRMKQKGIDVGPGSIIKYVITKRGEKIRDKARTMDEVSQKDYDAEYYIERQVIPSVERIINVLGYSKEDLKEGKGQSKLERFFG